jgi:hypothetical protein
MTRKDYKAIAEALKRVRPAPYAQNREHDQWERDLKAISGVLAADNRLFRQDKFEAACYEN